MLTSVCGKQVVESERMVCSLTIGLRCLAGTDGWGNNNGAFLDRP